MRVAKQRQRSKRRPAIQLQVKTVLNAIQRFPGFVYQEVRLCRHRDGQPQHIEIMVAPHPAIAAKCSHCLKAVPGYDRLPQRSWLFVPLWGIATRFLYAARRVQCPEHGVVIEHVPWSDGKRPVTIAMMCFLSRWARRLSWRETARAFGTSWECVYRSVEWFVEWGLAHRILEGIRAIGMASPVASKSPSTPTKAGPPSVPAASSRRRAMTNCRNVPGSLCRCGAS